SDMVSLSFFFQAEDGIRDRTVTGVQTCALPIFSIDISQTLYNKGKASTLYPLHLPKIVTAARVANAPHHRFITTGGIAITATARSEERRVGKECRSRTTPSS